MLLPWLYYWMFLCKAGRKLGHVWDPFELVSQAITYHNWKDFITVAKDVWTSQISTASHRGILTHLSLPKSISGLVVLLTLPMAGLLSPEIVGASLRGLGNLQGMYHSWECRVAQILPWAKEFQTLLSWNSLDYKLKNFQNKASFYAWQCHRYNIQRD